MTIPGMSVTAILLITTTPFFCLGIGVLKRRKYLVLVHWSQSRLPRLAESHPLSIESLGLARHTNRSPGFTSNSPIRFDGCFLPSLIVSGPNERLMQAQTRPEWQALVALPDTWASRMFVTFFWWTGSSRRNRLDNLRDLFRLQHGSVNMLELSNCLLR